MFQLGCGQRSNGFSEGFMVHESWTSKTNCEMEGSWKGFQRHVSAQRDLCVCLLRWQMTWEQQRCQQDAIYVPTLLYRRKVNDWSCRWPERIWASVICGVARRCADKSVWWNVMGTLFFFKKRVLCAKFCVTKLDIVIVLVWGVAWIRRLFSSVWRKEKKWTHLFRLSSAQNEL